MADQNHDIEKYLRGELSSSEMHALEKKALDDPFLSDALEGMGSVSVNDFTNDMQTLRASLRRRIEGEDKKVIALWPLIGRIAAGLLVIVVSGYIVLNLLSKDKRPDNLALNKPPVESKPVPAPIKTPESKTESTAGPAPIQDRDVERKNRPTVQPQSDDGYPLSEPMLSKEDIT